MSREQDEIEASLLAYSYAQAPLSLAGSALSAAIMTAFVARDGWVPALTPWLGAHAAISLLGVLGVRAFRSGAVAAPPRAKLVRLGGILSLALVWGAASMSWPLSTGETGVGILLCVSGLAAAATSTSAADPTGAILFNVLAFLPHLALQTHAHPWLSALIVLYLVAVTVIAVRNHRLLRTSLALRWSNTQLVAEAHAERQTALLEKQRAEHAAASRTRFLAMASHDLRQPVQALALFSDVLAHQQDEAKRTQVVASLARTSHALSAMLDSLLDISRLDAGIAVPAPSSVPVTRLLEDIASGLALEAESRGMVVGVAGRACKVWADRTMLARVVQNLAVNAVRHGGGRVLLSSRTRGARCLVQVWDQGPGIAEHDRERIFEELVQLERTSRDREKGLGLGLSMVRRLCELNAWTLTLQSRVGRGTVFTVELPLASLEASSTRRDSAPERRPISVLFVEDDADVRAATSTWLESRGCTLRVATRASEALHLWREAREAGRCPEVLVTDLGLPGGMSGAELALALRRDEPHLPIVIVTGAQTLPFDDAPPDGVTVLRKPVKGEALWQTMQRALAPR